MNSIKIDEEYKDYSKKIAREACGSLGREVIYNLLKRIEDLEGDCIAFQDELDKIIFD